MLRLAVCLAAFAAPLAAHEFWIDPLKFTVTPGAPLQAELRVGQAFEGGASSFNPRQFRRFDLVQDGEVRVVDGRAGDRPALNTAASGDGLTIVVHQTTDLFLTYREWEKFVAFCDHKDFAWAVDNHKARGLPETGFRERYSRHAKSLVAVGDGAGQDMQVGLEVEIVALANPYVDDMGNGLPVQVFRDGAALADVQVELFEKAPDGAVTVTLHRTDASGIARLPVKPGHSYLADHVVMQALEPGDDPKDPVWESLWASLTFAVPA